MKVWVKKETTGRYTIAPRNYKNISNFNKSPRLMQKHGFVEMIRAYSKETGSMEYFLDEIPAEYTKITYPGSDYVWNAQKDTWEIRLEVAKARKLEEIRNAVNAQMNELKKNFSNAEVETWSRQERGAKLLILNPETQEYDALWVKALAEARGISLEIMVEKITAAVATMNTAAYQIIGYQQKLEDLVNAAETVDEVYSISFQTDVYSQDSLA